MPNGFGPPPDLDVREPASHGRYLGWLGAVVHHTYEGLEELKGEMQVFSSFMENVKGDEKFKAGFKAAEQKQRERVSGRWQSAIAAARWAIPVITATGALTVLINILGHGF